MKHILLYENFEDPLGQSARGIFGLTSEFIIKYPVGISVTYTGPSEEESAAKEIVNRMGAEAGQIIDALAEIGWSEEGEYTIPGTGYSFKGSFRNWRKANHLISNLKSSAKYDAWKQAEEDENDDEIEKWYNNALEEMLASKETIQKFTEIGYRIERPTQMYENLEDQLEPTVPTAPLYHLTSHENRDRIEREGLHPRRGEQTQNFLSYPGRHTDLPDFVYALNNPEMKDTLRFGFDMWEIDLSKIDVKWYHDPNHPEESDYYITPDAIPASALTLRDSYPQMDKNRQKYKETGNFDDLWA